MTAEEALPKLHLYKPYDNGNCRQCHSMQGPHWKKVPEHRSLAEALVKNQVSCASAGCHGVAHPFSKPPSEAGLPKAFQIPTKKVTQ
jgi:cytochrome c-type protein NapC